MASRQLNLRFDEQHHDVVRRVVDRLRRDSSFLGTLEAVLASDSDPDGDRQAFDTLARLAQLEQRVQSLEAARPAPRARPAREVDSTPSTSSSAAGDYLRNSSDSGERTVTPADWTIGTKSKRLTPAGRAEVLRRIQAGEGDIEIGRAVGVSRETARRIRNEPPHQTDIEELTS
jgi:hypothetical protein